MEEKIASITKIIFDFDKIADKNDIFIMQYPHKIYTSVIKSKKKHFFTLAQSRYGNRYIWSDNEYLTSSSLIKNIQKNKIINKYTSVKYEPDSLGVINNKKVNFTLSKSISESIKALKRGFSRKLKPIRNDYGYYPFEWIKPIWRSRKLYKYVKSISIKPKDIKGKIIYFPLP